MLDVISSPTYQFNLFQCLIKVYLSFIFKFDKSVIAIKLLKQLIGQV